MSWPAILLAAALAASGPAPRKHHRVAPSLRQAAKAPKHKGVKLTRPHAAPRPSASPVPAAGGAPAPGAPEPGATPTPVATATPIPNLPSSTIVDLDDAGDLLTLRPARRILKAGMVTFNASNFGMDDHNLTVRGVPDASVDLPPDGETHPLYVTLAPGTYTLYCNVPTHESLGMWATITVQ